jgi:hypothetical protein
MGDVFCRGTYPECSLGCVLWTIDWAYWIIEQQSVVQLRWNGRASFMDYAFIFLTVCRCSYSNKYILQSTEPQASFPHSFPFSILWLSTFILSHLQISVRAVSRCLNFPAASAACSQVTTRTGQGHGVHLHAPTSPKRWYMSLLIRLLKCPIRLSKIISFGRSSCFGGLCLGKTNIR